MSFENLGLSPDLLAAVQATGYTTATPIQQKAIPIVLAGHDLLAAAQTGTGKTAAFMLPIAQRLAKPAEKLSMVAGIYGNVASGAAHKGPRALILAPTRELAAQIGENTAKLAPQLRRAVVFGGVGARPQIDAIQRGLDVLIATPGRLLDHAQNRVLDLRHVEILVLDEADRMLDMGFIHDIKRVIALLPKQRQSLLFSATFSEDIRRLATSLLKNPQSVEVAPRNATADKVEQAVYHVDKNRKQPLLSKLILDNNWQQTLVFTRTKHGANKLAEQLQRDGIQTAAIHGNKSQNARTMALQDFKAGKIAVLVATDIAARGIDIHELPQVVNYELPHVPEDYVHRIGRTARAGASGHAVSLVDGEEIDRLKAIERLLKKPLPVQTTPHVEMARGVAVERYVDPRARPASRPASRPAPRPASKPDGSRSNQWHKPRGGR
jgi:ATP-dependent RNA helicase RhlE